MKGNKSKRESTEEIDKFSVRVNFSLYPDKKSSLKKNLKI